jgi:drug/metabolite transporter (DMT)-like permease
MPVVGILFIIGLALLAAAATFTVERLVPAKRREPHNEVLGFVYAVIGVTYAVLLGLVVVSTWTTVDEAKANTYAEANALSYLDWYAYSLPQPQHAEIEDLLRQYTYTVIHTEWPEMARQQSSPEAWGVYTYLHEVIQAQQPTAPAAVARYQAAVDASNALGSARRERLNQAADEIPPLLWAALVLGGFFTIGFAFLFGMKSTATHAVIMFSLTMLIGGLLLVIYELNFPFSGIKVSPEAFELALNRMRQVP